MASFCLGAESNQMPYFIWVEDSATSARSVALRLLVEVALGGAAGVESALARDGVNPDCNSPLGKALETAWRAVFGAPPIEALDEAPLWELREFHDWNIKAVSTAERKAWLEASRTEFARWAARPEMVDQIDVAAQELWLAVGFNAPVLATRDRCTNFEFTHPYEPLPFLDGPIHRDFDAEAAQGLFDEDG